MAGGYFKLFLLAAPALPKLKALTPSRLTLAKANDHPGHRGGLHNQVEPQSMQAKLCKWPTCTCITSFQGSSTFNISMVHIEPACAESYFKSVAGPTSPNARLSKQGTVPRVSRHLFKSGNFRPLLPSDAFLVTAEYCHRQNRPWFDCKYELARDCKQGEQNWPLGDDAARIFLLLSSLRIFSPHQDFLSSPPSA